MSSENVANMLVSRDEDGNFAAGTITADLIGNASSCTDFSGNLSGDVTGTQGATVIASGIITNAKIAADAAIVDTKLATISTAGKVSNSATTATASNTASAIVARDSNGNFTAGTITANLTGTATSFSGSLSGDVTGTQGATVIGSGAVTNSKLAQVAANTIKGNNTGVTATVSDLTVTQATAMLNVVVGDSGSGGTKGLVPAPASGDAAANKYLKASGSWAALPTRATSQSTPSDPTATNSTTGVMMGLAGSFTPVVTGNVLIIICGDVDNATSNRGVAIQMRTGTGTAPINAAALTGTTRGSSVTFAQNNSAVRAPFSLNAVITGLTLNTAIWIDVSLAATGGAGTARIRDVSISAVEI